MNLKLLSFITAGIFTATAFSACHSRQAAAEGSPAASANTASEPETPALDPSLAPAPLDAPGAIVKRPGAAYLPRAIVYKTSVDVFDKVPLVMNAGHTSLVSFPAPSDIRDSQLPLRLADGWLLDRRGAIGPNTVFTRYTYAEYAALPSTPSLSELMSSIIPGAHVTMAYRLDLTLEQARNDTAAVNTLIRHNLPNATPLIP